MFTVEQIQKELPPEQPLAGQVGLNCVIWGKGYTKSQTASIISILLQKLWQQETQQVFGRISDDMLRAVGTEVAKTLPDGFAGFLKGWGWQQFTVKLVARIRELNNASAPDDDLDQEIKNDLSLSGKFDHLIDYIRNTGERDAARIELVGFCHQLIDTCSNAWGTQTAGWKALANKHMKVEDERDDDLIPDEKWCLSCSKVGHFTHECHSTHGLNTRADRELARLCEMSTRPGSLGEIEALKAEIQRLRENEKMDVEAWAELHTLRATCKAADGIMWQDHAVQERIRRVNAERELESAQREIAMMKSPEHRQVRAWIKYNKEFDCFNVVEATNLLTQPNHVQVMWANADPLYKLPGVVDQSVVTVDANLYKAWAGLVMGEDWNKGTHAKKYRATIMRMMQPYYIQPEKEVEDKGEPVWTHTLKGGLYMKHGEGKLQTDTPLSDMADVVIYRALNDKRLWVRAKAEFDERFIVNDIVTFDAGDSGDADKSNLVTRLFEKLAAGTLHEPHCNGDHTQRVGSTSTICNCTLGVEIKMLRQERDTAVTKLAHVERQVKSYSTEIGSLRQQLREILRGDSKVRKARETLNSGAVLVCDESDAECPHVHHRQCKSCPHRIVREASEQSNGEGSELRNAIRWNTLLQHATWTMSADLADAVITFHIPMMKQDEPVNTSPESLVDLLAASKGVPAPLYLNAEQWVHEICCYAGWGPRHTTDGKIEAVRMDDGFIHVAELQTIREAVIHVLNGGRCGTPHPSRGYKWYCAKAHLGEGHCVKWCGAPNCPKTE